MKFDYGDDVVVRTADQGKGALDKPATVVGVTSVETAEQSRVFGCPVGTMLYTVEFGDGSDALVTEENLEPLPSGRRFRAGGLHASGAEVRLRTAQPRLRRRPRAMDAL